MKKHTNVASLEFANFNLEDNMYLCELMCTCKPIRALQHVDSYTQSHQGWGRLVHSSCIISMKHCLTTLKPLFQVLTKDSFLFNLIFVSPADKHSSCICLTLYIFCLILSTLFWLYLFIWLFLLNVISLYYVKF